MGSMVYAIHQECVAVLTMLYKKNGAVSCVGSAFLSDKALYTANPQPVVIQFARNKRNIQVNKILEITSNFG